jgi:tetratricopeptide (TPR) repeat protein
MNIAAAATLLAALLIGMAPLHAAHSPDTPGKPDKGAESNAKELAASIERFNTRDPQSPDTLNARLSYAVLLAQMKGGDCRTRLDTAQSQLGVAEANPALNVALPAGLARAASAEYQVHVARAECVGTGPPDTQLRNTQLRAALESAQRAVALYRAAFDAVSMVTMQFNCAVAYRDLGDTAAAVSALQAAIAMDRDYGYEDDAEENYSRLLQWNHLESGSDQVAARMLDFPERSATLAFDWYPADSQVTVESSYSQVADGAAWSLHSTRSAQRSVRKGLASWRVSFQPAEAHFDLANSPLKDLALEGLATSIGGMLGQFHDFEVARNGDFNNGSGEVKFRSRVRADLKELSRSLAARDVPHAELMLSLAQVLKEQQSTDVVGDLLAESYNFETGTWIGATLDQGVWYNMTETLSLSLERQFFVKNVIEFAYTRPIRCTDDAKKTACIEIVLHATPDPAFLSEMVRSLPRSARLPHRQQPQLQARTDMRLIVDPVTLVAYRRDMRRYLYWSSGAKGQDSSLVELEKTSISSGFVTRTDGTQ